MALIKHEYPILERDTEPVAIIMPNRRQLYSLPEKCVFAFLGDTTDRYAAENECKEIAKFESITKLYPIYSTRYKNEEICFCQAHCGASAATQILDFLISYGVKYIIACGSCGAIDAIKKSADLFNIKFEECKTWTTDGFYRETKEMVAYRKQEGCSVVEMECSALAACAKFRGAIFGQILFAADILVNPDLYDERDWGKSAFDIVFILSLEAVRQK